MASAKTYWLQHHILNTLQDAFGKMIVRRSNLQDKDITIENSDAEALYLLAGATLAAVENSNSCLELVQWAAAWREKAKDNEELKDLPTRLDTWLAKCPALQTDVLAVLDKGDDDVPPTQPIILRTDAPTRAYLHRYYHYEKNVGARIRALTKDTPKAIANEIIQQLGNTNFQEKDPSQKDAIQNALQHKLAIITGGPGRGKTTVLTEFLAFRMKEFLDTEKRPMRVAICAPTGKAAARMKASINNALNTMSTEGQQLFEEIKPTLTELFPWTIHKLLGHRPDSDYPRRGAQNPLDYDLVAVDECSMMSLKLFSELLSALPVNAELVLLGDENQLQSVEEGNVLAELCKHITEPGIVNHLTVNHRSKDNVLLNEYTEAIVHPQNPTSNDDTLFSTDEKKYTHTASDGKPQGIFQGYELPAPKNLEDTIQEVLISFGILDEKGIPKVKCESIQDALDNLDSFKILAAIREGHYGVEGLNATVRKILNLQKPYADGMPIIVLKNDNVTGLNNGDIGVCFKNKVHFPGIDENGMKTAREFDPIQLPPHEPAFAMTIHKSQGSDYKNVLMVLPDKDLPLLTRELVYTGMTRTKINFVLLANKEILHKAKQRKTIRWSGLKQWIES